jgi:O-antigen/teichoic acid export membrane protein
MRRYFENFINLAQTKTAKDSYTLFAGNLLSAFLGFLYVLFIARTLTVEEFGVFSAVTNLIIIIVSISDIGITSGVVSFVARNIAAGDEAKADKYIKAAFVLKYVIIFIAVVLMGLFAPIMARYLLASEDVIMAHWTALLSLGILLWMFVPALLQAKKKFIQSVAVDLSLVFPRALIVVILMFAGLLTLQSALAAYLVGIFFVAIASYRYLGAGFLRKKPEKNIYIDLVKFSGWLGVNKIISSISGRLDIQMLAFFVGASATGVYSVPSRLASFIVVIATSYTAVLIPRLAGFGDKDKERRYLVKATVALTPVVGGVVIWIFIANPFIVLLFGERYRESVPVFQMLAMAMIPLLISVPAVAAIIYAIRKPVYIGVFSAFNLVAIFLLNYIFIPQYGVLGPTITLSVVYSLYAVYTWVVVIRHYWIKRPE